jgi:predicted ABC-type ATPase
VPDHRLGAAKRRSSIASAKKRRSPRAASASQRALRTPAIYVLAGVNGAGKSSVMGAAVRAAGGDYINPDELARGIRAASPGMSVTEANAAAWMKGKEQLEQVIATRGHYAFETTLGGRTISQLLAAALTAGMEVHVSYVGLTSPEQHIARVRARVARGGHDIPEAKIRERYDGSRRNLIRLMPRLASLRVFDNSFEAPPEENVAPEPVELFEVTSGVLQVRVPLDQVPEWAKPLFIAALPKG